MLRVPKHTKAMKRKDTAPTEVEARAKARSRTDREVGTARTRFRIGRRVDGAGTGRVQLTLAHRRKKRCGAHKACQRKHSHFSLPGEDHLSKRNHRRLARSWSLPEEKWARGDVMVHGNTTINSRYVRSSSGTRQVLGEHTVSTEENQRALDRYRKN